MIRYSNYKINLTRDETLSQFYGQIHQSFIGIVYFNIFCYFFHITVRIISNFQDCQITLKVERELNDNNEIFG